MPVHELGKTTERFSHYVGDEEATWWALKCASCLRYTVVMAAAARVLYYPPEGVTRIRTEGVPPNIVADYDEAIRCLQASAYKAATAMARRAVQAVCIDLDANPKSKLYQQINELNERGEFTNRLQRLAHKVRAFGNSGVHPGEDGLDEMTPQDAEEAVRFVEHLLQHVYILGGEEEEEET